MSKTFQKFKKQYDIDDSNRSIKKLKAGKNNKQLRKLDNALKSKDVSKFFTYEEKY
jgi:hypothetical protein